MTTKSPGHLAPDGSEYVTVTNGAGTNVFDGTTAIPTSISGTVTTNVTNSTSSPISVGNALRANTAGFLVATSTTLVRPANTTAYAAGQAVGGSTGTLLLFSSAITATAGGGLILGGRLYKGTRTTTNASFRLWLYNAIPSTVPASDQASYAPALGERFLHVGYIDFATAIDNGVFCEYEGTLGRANTAFHLASGTTLYGVLVAQAAYTPGSGELFTPVLDVVTLPY